MSVMKEQFCLEHCILITGHCYLDCHYTIEYVTRWHREKLGSVPLGLNPLPRYDGVWREAIERMDKEELMPAEFKPRATSNLRERIENAKGTRHTQIGHCCGESEDEVTNLQAEVARLVGEVTAWSDNFLSEQKECHAAVLERDRLRQDVVHLRTLIAQKDVALRAVPRILYGLDLDARRAQIAQKAIDQCRKALEAK